MLLLHKSVTIGSILGGDQVTSDSFPVACLNTWTAKEPLIPSTDWSEAYS
jgi:hypothetical protein